MSIPLRVSLGSRSPRAAVHQPAAQATSVCSPVLPGRQVTRQKVVFINSRDYSAQVRGVCSPATPRVHKWAVPPRVHSLPGVLHRSTACRGRWATSRRWRRRCRPSPSRPTLMPSSSKPRPAELALLRQAWPAQAGLLLSGHSGGECACAPASPRSYLRWYCTPYDEEVYRQLLDDVGW